MHVTTHSIGRQMHRDVLRTAFQAEVLKGVLGSSRSCDRTKENIGSTKTVSRQ
jgi:hypothetical protein